MHSLLHLSPGSLLALIPFGIVGVVSWTVWIVRRTLSHSAQPITNSFTTTVSAVVPVFHEDIDILKECLRSWVAEEPDELIIVVDTADTASRTMLAEADLPTWVDVIPFPHQGKRSALAVGIRAATSEIVVLSDSDTAWEPGLIREIQMPFIDPEVGGVGTRQTVAARDTSEWRRIAAWMLNLRYKDYVPAMGAKGAVACLSGRTAAYRRELITPMLPDLEHEIFLGRECVAGDDGRLTWLVLGAGYKTVHQDTAHAVSMFPSTFGGFTQQRLRWARNSYRCYLTAGWKGWLWKQPLVTQVTVLQILLTPLTMGIAVVYLVHAFANHTFARATFYLLWFVVGRAIRGISHLREHPEDLRLVPMMTVVMVFLAVPLKLLAFVTMNEQGWLTRDDDHGPKGQSSGSLDGNALLS